MLQDIPAAEPSQAAVEDLPALDDADHGEVHDEDTETDENIEHARRLEQERYAKNIQLARETLKVMFCPEWRAVLLVASKV